MITGITMLTSSVFYLDYSPAKLKRFRQFTFPLLPGQTERGGWWVDDLIVPTDDVRLKTT